MVVKALRKEYGLTQEDLAMKSGVGLCFVRNLFHKYNIASITRFAASRALEEGAERGLDGIASLYFVNDQEKGRKAMEVMACFDNYASKGRGNLMDTLPIAECICWTGLPLSKGYKFFQSTYNGKYDLPKKKSVWARFDSFKKSDPEAAKDGGMERKFAADFENRLRLHLS